MSEFIFWFWKLLGSNNDLWALSLVWSVPVAVILGCLCTEQDSALYEKPITTILIGLVFVCLYPFWHIIVLIAISVYTPDFLIKLKKEWK